MTKSTTEVPTELYMELIKLLDVIPPILKDWIQTTGFGEINRRDKAALADVERATKLHHEFLAASEVTVDSKLD